MPKTLTLKRTTSYNDLPSSSSGSVSPEMTTTKARSGCLSSPRTAMSASTKGPGPTDVNKLFATEMNALSLQERNRVLEDIHGVAKLSEEDPKFIDTCMELLEGEIRKISYKLAYERALFLSPRHVLCREFRIMFLRAERFDIVLAAKRITVYFEHKLQLFGETKLVKDIALEDLTDQDREALLTGSFQSIGKDQAGRTVLFNYHALVKYNTDEDYVRDISFSVKRELQLESARFIRCFVTHCIALFLSMYTIII
jgi:hypothetical protein